MRELVRTELDSLCEFIDTEIFTISDCMDIRELLHLQDFHKFILFKNIGFLERFVKQKVEQNWRRICLTHRVDSIERPSNLICPFSQKAKKNQKSKKNLFLSSVDVDRQKIIMDISAGLMNFPNEWQQFTHNVRLISRCICLEIHDEIHLWHRRNSTKSANE